MGKVGTEATLQEIKGLVETIARGSAVSTWGGYNVLVKSGNASARYPAGSQITDTWYKDAETSYTAPWDIVHYKSNGDSILKWHYGIPTDIPFDAPEAIYYAPAGGLEAGQYYITVKTAYGDGWVADSNINFTLTEAMEEGDQLYIECSTSNANNPTDGRTWTVYAKGDTTAKQTGTTSNSDTGTKLGETSSSGANYRNGYINSVQAVVYGYGRWSQSAIRQNLNSAAAANAWWTAQNGWDRPPAQHSTVRGFMAGIDSDLLSIISKTSVVTALNTADAATEGITTETTEDWFFLPSLEEMYITPQLADVEGEEWDYFADLAEEAGLTGKFAQYGTYDILKTYRVSSTSSAVLARLRSAYRAYASNTWRVLTSGYVNGNYAYTTMSGCPACTIKKSA